MIPFPSRACRAVIAALLVVTALPELALLLADWGLVGSPRWRSTAYQYGAFWSGLLRDWRANYAAQPAAMFLSYALLHTGPGHLAGNLMGLIWLGREIGRRYGARALVLIWILAALGGAAAYGLLAPSFRPMVGASGAVFGLAGALTPRLTGPEGPRPALAWAGLMVAANLVVWILESGALAWQTHLGGFVAGFLVSRALARRGAAMPAASR